jgi:predicted deacylase
VWSSEEVKAFVRLHLKQRAYDYPAPDSSLGVVPIGYDPDAFARTIRGFDDRYDIVEEARVSYLDTNRSIFSVSSRSPGAGKRLLIGSGIHGNEQAGILSVPAILERYANADVALKVLTPINAVGAAEVSRFNADGYDINRDFLQFRTAEARLVRSVFDDFRPDFVLSLHEGPQLAAFMFANRHVDIALAKRLLAALEAGGTTLATKDYFHLPLKPPGLSASSRLQRVVLRLWEVTLKQQAVNEFAAARGIPEITLETGWRNTDGEARIRAHVDLAMALTAELGA